jgi:hypothetical protein
MLTRKNPIGCYFYKLKLLIMSHEDYQSCIDACYACATECLHCENACLGVKEVMC